MRRAALIFLAVGSLAFLTAQVDTTATVTIEVRDDSGALLDEMCFGGYFWSVDDFYFLQGGLGPYPNPLVLELDPGEWRFRAASCDDGWAREYWDGKHSLSTADSVFLGEGEDLTLVFELDRPATIATRVVSQDGAPVNDVQVSGYGADGGFLGTHMTGTDGVVSFDGLFADAYRFHVEGVRAWAVDEWVGGADFATASAFPLPAGSDVQVDLPVSVDHVGTLTFAIEDTVTLELASGCYEYFDPDGNLVYSSTVDVLADEGSATVSLPAGTNLKLRYRDCLEAGSNFRLQVTWTGGVQTSDAASLVEVPLFDHTYPAEVPNAYYGGGLSRIWGNVVSTAWNRGIGGTVDAFQGGTLVGSGLVDPLDGYYEVFGIPPGDYTLRFVPNDDRHHVTWYPSADDSVGAVTVSVDDFVSTTANFIVPPTLASMSGQVTDGVSAVAGADVDILAGGVVIASTVTGNDGAFAFDELLLDDYVVRASAAGYFTEWHGGAPALREDLATAIALGVDGVTGIEIELDPLFSDVAANSTFADEIAWLRGTGITAGCTATEFCPGDSVTRAQMATFLARALGLEASGPAPFSDVSGTHAQNIAAIAEAGITAGCDASGALFCPSDSVTRAQMATFLARALGYGPAVSDYFSDDSGSPHEPNINALREAEVTLGCDATGIRYCPSDPVTRGQMAAFLARALADLYPAG